MALIVNVGADVTYALPSKMGDVLVWTRVASNLSPEVQVLDVWELRDGDAVLLTNRPHDFPSWFHLHPTEVSGTAVLEMSKRLEGGWQPGPIVHGPNIWRILAGDRVAWLGEPRPPYESDEGLLAVFDLRSNALILGWLPNGELLDWIGFGGVPQHRQEELTVAAGVALQVIRQLGMPRTVGVHWSIP